MSCLLGHRLHWILLFRAKLCHPLTQYLVSGHDCVTRQAEQIHKGFIDTMQDLRPQIISGTVV